MSFSSVENGDLKTFRWENDLMDALQQARHLMLAVQTLHRRGYERVRLVPRIADSPGGGVWQCEIVPVTAISSQHGAVIDGERRVPRWQDSYFYTSRHWRHWATQEPFLSDSLDETADFLLSSCASLREDGCGADSSYVQWYTAMIDATHPTGVIYAEHFEDYFFEPPTDRLRALSLEDDIVIPLPPLGPA